MLSFGLTNYKLLETIANQRHLTHANSPQRAELVLVASGTDALVFCTISYWTTLNDPQWVEPFRLGRAGLVIAMIMSIIDVVALLAPG